MFTIRFLLVAVLTSTGANALDINWCGDQVPPQTELETNIPFTLKPFNLKCKSPKLNTTLHPGLIESLLTINGTEDRTYFVTGILKLTGHLRLNRTKFLHTSQYCVSKLWQGTEPGTAEYCDQEAECGQNGLECIPLCCPPDLLFTTVVLLPTGILKVVCKSINSTHYTEEGYEKQLKALEKPGTKAVSYFRGKANECSKSETKQVTTASRYHRGHWDPSASPESKRDYFKRTENGDYLLCNDALDAWVPMKVVCLNIDSTRPGRPSEVGIPETVVMECVEEMPKSNTAKWWFIYYYACMMTIGILFQLFVFVIYAMVWRQLGFGSRIIMGYSLSLFFLYLIFGIRYFYTSADSFGTTECQVIGILGHYAWMSTFAWLLLINLNLFFIIWRPKAMNPGIRAPSDKWRIARYILFGWGLPGVYVIICAFIDSKYDRIEHKCTTPAPLYSHNGCFVHASHAGIFMYYPSAFVLTINLILFIACLAKLYSPQQAKTLKNSSNRPQLFGIYARMFLVGGVYWILELIVWILIESGNHHATRDIIIHTIKFLLTFISFIIFVTGSNITKPLMNNYRGVRVSARWASRQLSQVTFFSRTSFSKDNADVTTT